MNETLTQIFTLFHSGVVFGTIIMFGALGEIVTEKSGHLNLGVPGIMYLGGISGLMASFFYENGNPDAKTAVSVILAIVFCFIGSALGGLIYAFLTISLRANQNVTGLALTIFGSGFANFFGGMLNKLSGGVGQISVNVASSGFRAYISSIAGNDTGDPLYAIFGYGWLAYVAILCAILLHFVLNKTRVGLCLRAVGEDPATADAAGINVTKYKYLSICVGAGISGFGGLYYTMDYIKGTWANDGTMEALGWLAVALVIFTTWRPLNAIWGAILFGVCYWSYLYIPGLNRSSIEIFKMIPYVVTLAVLIIVSLRKKRETQPPAHLGLPYFREER